MWKYLNLNKHENNIDSRSERKRIKEYRRLEIVTINKIEYWEDIKEGREREIIVKRNKNVAMKNIWINNNKLMNAK